MITETLTREKPTALAATMAELGRRAARSGVATRAGLAEVKVTALKAAAAAVRGRQNEISPPMPRMSRRPRASGIGAALVDRLALDPKRVEAVAQGLEDIAALPDPVGRVLAEWTRPNGLGYRASRCRSASSASSMRAGPT